MKKTTIVALTIMVSWAQSQVLTKEQLEVAALVASQQTTASSVDQAAVSTSPGAMYLEDLLVEAAKRSVTVEKRLKAVKSKSTTTEPSTTEVIMSLVGEGGGGEALMEDPCGQNPYIFYNLSPFDSYWYSPSSTTYERPWHLSTYTINGTNGYGAESYYSYNYGPYLARSTLYKSVPNDYDQYGDAKAHVIKFWYVFTTSSSVNDKFWCNISFLSDSVGIAVTNLPYSGSWRRVSLYVRPYQPAVMPDINFVTFKASTQLYVGPTANLDPSVAWCTINTPDTGLKINDVGTNVVVSWNIPAYNSNRWDLLYAGVVTGPYVTYTGAVSVSNGLAWTTFAKDDSRFYLLRHK